MLSESMAPVLHDDDRRFNGRVQSLHQISTKASRRAASYMDPVLLLKAHNAMAEIDCAENISVALEWKLLLPLLAPGQKDPRPDDGRPIVEVRAEDADKGDYLEHAFESIAQTVRRAGETAVTMHSLAKDGLAEKDFWDSSWVVKKANSVEPLAEEKSCREYIWVGVEICSPKLRLKGPDTEARILKVLAALNLGHRLAANCTCEVHVHLGRMDGRPWSLSTLKRLAALLWVAEPTLRSIRNPQSPNYQNIYTWGFPLRQRSRLAGLVGNRATTVHLPSISDLQVIDALQRQKTIPTQELHALVEIWNTTSHLELGQLLSGPDTKYRRLGFNFSAFGEEDERARRNPRTMEFRIMEGSINADLVSAWLRICGNIAETAVTASDGRFSSALAVSLRQSDKRRRAEEASGSVKETLSSIRRGRDFRELMEALGVPEQHYRHFEEKIKREHRRLS
jgi:hypothetical protein